MSNKEISDVIELTSKLMTLHGEDETRAKIYGGTAFNLDRLEEDLSIMSEAELMKLRGVGKSMATNILQIVATGITTELQELINKTPEGVLEMFKVKGIGVKKIKTLWEELGIDNLNDLQIACESGKIAETKGFGQKTQEKILESLLFLRQQSGKLRMNQAAELSTVILTELSGVYNKVEEVGAIPRKLETIDALSFLVAGDITDKSKLPEGLVENMKVSSPFIWRGTYGENQILIEVQFEAVDTFEREKLICNASEDHLKVVLPEGQQNFYHYVKSNIFDTSEAYYAGFGSNYILPEMREGLSEFDWIKENSNDDLISWDALKGSLHNHSKYSDGKNTLKEMSEACRDLGLDYFGIADHSQTATYAGGLTAGRVVQQQSEIDEINAEMTPFKVLKGIESDILSDGGLDYESEILATFDYVVASVHANLDMNIEKATDRVLKAVENPYTTILGHPTGRLLLSRKGYPLDFKKVIDACAANKVIMEINASPYRLDIDWRWIPYCLEKGVMLSINPDAHKIEGFQDMHYGVAVARKAGLTKDMTFNAMSLDKLESFLKSRKA
ncbi:DNA polymerase/3'-5' exonuclease PolX [Arcticibacterium luteifluviistationis]|uniref:DNA polymerase/3'-5' exonuclease PolX n=1 Tax=Arcticibacterium luteifluviistationis TaxID=1784714 RepID=A0A2Z4GC81_9BACT|nr:DNA polymerase/3'-5' exonuclease PolX [Arcticibacterium luteifluviistationis]AWV98645.1 DNA polymerase/3'-5' exonuclease PolX [Arcticibacterium luteifluviistationis]